MEDLPMGRMISKKLRSSKGASLTFALLAFLVCAVISAVLLASASAATGRLSNLAETDQRYYAVTSAAQLFCDELNGQEFTIERKHTNYDVKFRGYMTVEGNVIGFPINFDEEDIRYWFGESVFKMFNQQNVFSFYASGLGGLLSEGPITDEGLSAGETETSASINGIREKSLLADIALSYVIGENRDGSVSCPVSQAFNKTPGQQFLDEGSLVDEIKFGTFCLEYTGTDATEIPDDVKDAIAVTAVARLRKDGSIVIEFCDGSDPTKPSYKVTVTLSAEVTDNSDLPLTVSSDSTSFRFDPLNAIYYECTVTTTVKTKTTTIKWNVTDIKKGAEEAA